MLFNQEEVRTFLPHREPFIFIDDIESITYKKHNMSINDIEGAHVVGHYYCDADHPIFKGHFPDNPILPGVIQVEMMAQVCPFTVSKIEGLSLGEGPEMALLGITNAKFRKPVRPDMHLTIEAKCIKPRGAVMTFECSISCNDEIMSQCSITAYMPLLKKSATTKSLRYEEFAGMQ